MKKIVLLLFLFSALLSSAAPLERPRKSDVLKLIEQTNAYWQSKNARHGNYFWNRAVYHVGNMEAYRTTGNADYLAFSKAWAERNNWSGPEDEYDWFTQERRNWVYSYGENHVLFGDCQICFQVYSEIFDVDAQDYYLSRANEVMGYEIETEETDYLWWADGLFMLMPVMTHMYHQTGNVEYLHKMYAYWRYAVELMWDTDEHLFYRDGSYVFPKAKTVAGGKDFWARGDGWVFAALARVLKDFDQYVDTDSDSALKAQKDEYVSYYNMMAGALKASQQPEGFWSRSILDISQAPGYESTGTELMLYGFAWGVDNGYFSEADYGETIDKAWRYLTDIAVQYDGSVGYMQPIGSSASPGTYVGVDSQADFGMGGFLLAASEMYRYATDDGYHRSLCLRSAKAESPSVIRLTFNLDVAASAADISLFTVDGAAVEGAVSVENNVVTLRLSSDLSYGHSHEIGVGVLNSADYGAMAAAATVSVYVDMPIEVEQYYAFRHHVSGLYMNITNDRQKVMLSEHATPLRFVETDGGYYLTNGTDYVGMTGEDRWTMSSLEAHAAVWTLSSLGDGLYSIDGQNGSIGTDHLEEGSSCYGDKKNTQENAKWHLVAQLTNLDFDVSSSFVANHVITYAKDLSQNGTTYCHQQPVDGWVRAADDVDGKAAAAFAYGTEAYLATRGYFVPAADANGNSDGGVLGLCACWGQTVQYTQQTTLPAGDYVMTYQYYNAGGANAVSENLSGFITKDGEAFVSSLREYAVEAWHTDTIAFSLGAATTGVVSLGYKSENVGSGDSPKLFIDNVSIKPAEEETDIKDIKSAEAEGDGAVYSLQGLRVQRPQRGSIYIKNNRKVVFR